jgi:hypothetical protein
MARPAGRHLVSYRLGQVGGAHPRPYKYPPLVEIRTQTPLHGNFTCKALILSVVARRSLVGRVAKLLGPEGLLAYRDPPRSLSVEAPSESFGVRQGFSTLVWSSAEALPEFYGFQQESLCLSTLGEVGVPACWDHSASMPQI